MGIPPMQGFGFEDLKPKSREFGAGGLQPTPAPPEEEDQIMKFWQQMQQMPPVPERTGRDLMQSVLKRNPLDGLMDDINKPMHRDGPLMPVGDPEFDEQGRRIAPSAPKRMGPERGPY